MAGRLIRTVLVATILSFLGWVCAGISVHGPDILLSMAKALIPGALLVPHVTGTYVGVDRLSFALFIVVQLAYYHVLLSALAPIRKLMVRARRPAVAP